MIQRISNNLGVYEGEAPPETRQLEVDGYAVIRGVFTADDVQALLRSSDPRVRALAAEVAGRDEREPELRAKSRWYLRKRVSIIWIVLPERREVLVVTGAGESRHRTGDRLPSDSRLPDLSPAVEDLFIQVSRAE